MKALCALDVVTGTTEGEDVMGNAADCNYCNNHGKPWSFGCPKCHRFDRRENDDKAWEKTLLQYRINREVAERAEPRTDSKLRDTNPAK